MTSHWELYSELELMSSGLTMETLTTVIYGTSFAWLIFYNVFGILLFFGLYVYHDQTHPGDFGVPRASCFCCRPSFWVRDVCGQKRQKSESTTT